MNGAQSQFCHLTHENANRVLCDVRSEAEERVLLIEKQYVLCKVRVYVTETVENREYNVIYIYSRIDINFIDEIYAWFAERTGRRPIKMAVEYSINIMGAHTMTGWRLIYSVMQDERSIIGGGVAV
jgi:hypothetical protein